jgi:hypothetical protein
MSTASGFKARFLTASEYVLDLFGPTENVAVVVLNRATGRTIQRIARADTVAGTTAIAIGLLRSVSTPYGLCSL